MSFGRIECFCRLCTPSQTRSLHLASSFTPSWAPRWLIPVKLLLAHPGAFRKARYFTSGTSHLSSRVPLATPNSGPTPQPPLRRWNPTWIAFISVGTLSIGYLLGTAYPPRSTPYQVIIKQLFPSKAPSLVAPLVDGAAGLRAHPAETYLSLEDHPIIQDLEGQLADLKVVKELKSQPQIWKCSRPFSNSDLTKTTNNLTLGSLRGVGKFAILPLVFVNQDHTEAVIVQHVGQSLCGFEGIVHGGLSATICDEGLARLALANLPSKVGVTASLKLNYKKPVFANQFIILRSKLVNRDQRKVVVNGTIENLQGEVLVQAEALFVEPKYVKFLKTSFLKEVVEELA